MNGGSVINLFNARQVVDGGLSWRASLSALAYRAPFLAFPALALSAILLGYAALVIVERSKR